MKVYAVVTGDTVELSELELYVSRAKAEKVLMEAKQSFRNKTKAMNAYFEKQGYELRMDDISETVVRIAELEVEEYPDLSELQAWVNDLKTEENRPGIADALKRAEKYNLYWEVLYSAYEQQGEPDFEIVSALQDACYRWAI